MTNSETDNTTESNHSVITPKMMSTKEAATYLGYSEKTLRESRVSGKLAGIRAPLHYCLNRRVRYQREDLDEWLSQFKPRYHTGQTEVNIDAD